MEPFSFDKEKNLQIIIKFDFEVKWTKFTGRLQDGYKISYFSNILFMERENKNFKDRKWKKKKITVTKVNIRRVIILRILCF